MQPEFSYGHQEIDAMTLGLIEDVFDAMKLNTAATLAAAIINSTGRQHSPTEAAQLTEKVLLAMKNEADTRLE